MAFQISGVTRDNNGNLTGSVDVFLLKYNSGTHLFTQVAHTVSDVSNATFTFSTIADGDSAYNIVAFKDGSPHSFDVSDRNLTPQIVGGGGPVLDIYGAVQSIAASGGPTDNDYINLTSTTGANAVVLAFLHDGTGDDTTVMDPAETVVTYDPTGAAQTMTLLASSGAPANSVGKILVGWWGLLNPTNKGNITIRITTQSTAWQGRAIASSWSGVTSMSDAHGESIAPSSPFNYAFTSAANRVTMAAFSSRFNDFATTSALVYATTRFALEAPVTNMWIDEITGAAPTVLLGANVNASAKDCPIAGFSLA